MEITSTMIWLVLVVACLIIEIPTVGLTTIWLAGGGLVGLLLDILGVDLVWQIVAAIVVTIVLLVFTRPFAVKHINNHYEKTNYEGIIGKHIRISDRVDNMDQTGRTVLDGQEWTVRSLDDNIILEPGEMAKVVKISGVKLIVEKYEEE